MKKRIVALLSLGAFSLTCHAVNDPVLKSMITSGSLVQKHAELQSCQNKRARNTVQECLSAEISSSSQDLSSGLKWLTQEELNEVVRLSSSILSSQVVGGNLPVLANLKNQCEELCSGKHEQKEQFEALVFEHCVNKELDYRELPENEKALIREIISELLPHDAKIARVNGLLSTGAYTKEFLEALYCAARTANSNALYIALGMPSTALFALEGICFEKLSNRAVMSVDGPLYMGMVEQGIKPEPSLPLYVACLPYC